MFRLARANASYARPLVASVLPRPSPALNPPAAVATGIRTYKRKARPDPRRSEALFRMLWKKFELTDGSPEATYKMYDAYLKALANRRDNKNWESNFLAQTRANGHDVHAMAFLITMFPNMREEEQDLLYHVLNTAAGIGYDASALTLGRILVNNNHPTHSAYSYWAPQWAHMRQHVDYLIKRGHDANAVVLEGLLALARNTTPFDRLALSAFKRARVLGEEMTWFDWEQSCLMGMAEAYRRLDRLHKSIEMFKVLEAKSYAMGVFELAKADPKGADYLPRLTRAAVSGFRQSYQPLMDEHLRLSDEYRKNGDEKKAEEHLFWAVEIGNILKYRRNHHKD
ncbi:hypothetical protein CcaCcLH18_00892 [Colletotrichum camelliae]|nr:hypothetical protein CcaCcLH18_00892 [Colletotrichum camelliae]